MEYTQQTDTDRELIRNSYVTYVDSTAFNYSCHGFLYEIKVTDCNYVKAEWRIYAPVNAEPSHYLNQCWLL